MNVSCRSTGSDIGRSMNEQWCILAVLRPGSWVNWQPISFVHVQTLLGGQEIQSNQRQSDAPWRKHWLNWQSWYLQGQRSYDHINIMPQTLSWLVVEIAILQQSAVTASSCKSLFMKYTWFHQVAVFGAALTLPFCCYHIQTVVGLIGVWVRNCNEDVSKHLKAGFFKSTIAVCNNFWLVLWYELTSSSFIWFPIAVPSGAKMVVRPLVILLICLAQLVVLVRPLT